MKNNQNYLVIEQLDSGFQISSILLDKSNGLELLSVDEISNLNEIKKSFSFIPYIILALDSKHATTIEKKITLERSRPKQEISESEMDQLVFKILWSFLNKYRQFASRKMKIADLDIVLSEIEIKKVFLESKHILNPIGFKGKKITFQLRGTLMSRDSLKLVELIRNFGKEIKTVERLSIISSFAVSAPHRIVRDSSDFLIHAGEKNTEIFSFNGEELRYRKRVSWGTDNTISPIVKYFSINRSAAFQILEKYFNGEVSKRLNRVIKGEIEKSFETLNKLVKGITQKKKARILINIPKPIFRAVFSKDEKAEHLNLMETLESRDFSVIIKPDISPNSLVFNRRVEPLIPAGAGLFSNHYENLNRMLKRRSKWLVPHS